MHNAHAQVVDHAHFRHLTMTIPRQKIMVLSSEIIVIVARSSAFIALSGQNVGH